MFVVLHNEHVLQQHDAMTRTRARGRAAPFARRGAHTHARQFCTNREITLSYSGEAAEDMDLYICKVSIGRVAARTGKTGTGRE